MKRVLGLVLAVTIEAAGGKCDVMPLPAKNGPVWLDKNCTFHYGNIVPSSKAVRYEVYYGDWGLLTNQKVEYRETRLRIRRSNRCFFLKKGGDDGWKKSDIKVLSDDEVEIKMRGYCCKGCDMSFSEKEPTIEELKRDYWNVFDMPFTCSQAPSVEWWTVYQKFGNMWKVVAKQKFYIEP